MDLGTLIPSVLIVHDHAETYLPMKLKIHRETRLPKNSIFTAENTFAALEIVKANIGIVMIIIDGRVPAQVGGEADITHSVAFVRELKSSDHGAFRMTYSAYDEFNQALKDAGCNMICRAGEINTVIIPKLKEILAEMNFAPPAGN